MRHSQCSVFCLHYSQSSSNSSDHVIQSKLFQDVFLLEPGSVPECLASLPLVLAIIGCSWIVLDASGIALIPLRS